MAMPAVAMAMAMVVVVFRTLEAKDGARVVFDWSAAKQKTRVNKRWGVTCFHIARLPGACYSLRKPDEKTDEQSLMKKT